MVKYATALRLGTAGSESILRRFTQAIVNTGEHEETEATLRHVRRHFVTRDNMRRAGPR
ncbi:hypothetical protein AB0L63_03665 [Nocardia sp. NPDC051990]|uniref:hypothetical protein n=1 Tax=Nocardia sp. NPDC051990 TaxID=3155285 RepID=UPI003426681E